MLRIGDRVQLTAEAIGKMTDSPLSPGCPRGCVLNAKQLEQERQLTRTWAEAVFVVKSFYVWQGLNCPVCGLYYDDGLSSLKDVVLTMPPTKIGNVIYNKITANVTNLEKVPQEAR